MNPKHAACVSLALAVLALSACATSTKSGAVGADRSQLLIVPASEVDAMALAGYTEQNQKAKSAGKLVTKGAELDRLNRIAARLQAQVPVFRDDAARWKWQLALIDAPLVNATCAPGGKITFYTGLMRQLKLTDDEAAMIMGHEIAHALREHGRERLSQAKAQSTLGTLALTVGGKSSAQISSANHYAHYLFVLPNSRLHESEADTMGLELAARAGYDPRAAISVWEKMSALSGGKQPAEFSSTHPSHTTRILDIKAMLPKVMPLHAAAKK